MRSLLDSLASRLDESRDISRYLVGLLIFLGLLGTFWGLLETVTSVGDAIKALDVTAGPVEHHVREAESRASKKPLAGMGLSFSSSLFGLAGSLILGFLDLQGEPGAEPLLQRSRRLAFDHHRHRRRATATASAHAAITCGSTCRACNGHRADEQDAGRSWDREPAAPAASAGRTTTESIEQLADAVASLVQQMREEQKMVRHWAQTQQVQQNEIQRLLMRAGRAAGARAGPRLAVEDEE